MRAMQTAGYIGSEREFAKLLATSPPRGWETRGPPETWSEQWANEIIPLAIQAHAGCASKRRRSPLR